jgi:cysteine desulfurase
LVDEIKRKFLPLASLGLRRAKGRLCNQLNIVFEGVEGEALMLMANVKGLDCHTGISCVNRHMENNRISKATGLPDDLFRSSLLLSWHEGHTEQDLHQAVISSSVCVAKLREMSPVWKNCKVVACLLV